MKPLKRHGRSPPQQAFPRLHLSPQPKCPKSSPPCIDRGGPHWCLSNGTPVAAEVGAIIIETPEVATGDDVLFAGIAVVIKREKS